MSNTGVRWMNRKRIITIIISAVITIMTQITISVPIKGSDTNSGANSGISEIQKNEQISLSNVLYAFAAGPKEVPLPMNTTTTKVTTSTSTTSTTTTTFTTTTMTTSLTTTTQTIINEVVEEVVEDEEEVEYVEYVETQEEVTYEEAPPAEKPVTVTTTEPPLKEPCIYNEDYDVYVPEYGDYNINDYIVEPAISDSEYILLCNALGHEYGSDTVSVQEKAKVIETIMNRVNSPLFPNTIYGVITQPGQFTGCWSYANLGVFSYEVTASVKEAVTYYFDHLDEYQHGYLYFRGYGGRNYFSCTYNGY